MIRGKEAPLDYLPSGRDGGFYLPNPRRIIGSVLTRLNLPVEPEDESRNEQLKALRKIKEMGGIDKLVELATRLRERGLDQTAIVVEYTTGADVMVQLRYDLKKRSQLVGSWWDSKGIALETTAESEPKVRFTDGSSWNYLGMVGSSTHSLEHNQAKAGIRLHPQEIAQLKSMKDAPLPLDTQLVLAMRLAHHQSDYRYGEGEMSRVKIRNPHYRYIYPTKHEV